MTFLLLALAGYLVVRRLLAAYVCRAPLMGQAVALLWLLVCIIMRLAWELP